jgi:hypothetical protein
LRTIRPFFFRALAACIRSALVDIKASPMLFEPASMSETSFHYPLGPQVPG